MSHKIALVLGAGANVGLATVKRFAREGWKVAAAARTIRGEVEVAADMTIVADFEDPTSMAKLFDQVHVELGIPSVIVYNVYGRTWGDREHPFGFSLESFVNDTNTNLFSFYAASQQALNGFVRLPESVPKTMIFTGNMQNHALWPEALTLGVGKLGASHLIQAAHRVFGSKYRFYYVDERRTDGSPAYELTDGPAHADTFFELATGVPRDWEVNFVSGEGIKYFGANVGGWKP